LFDLISLTSEASLGYIVRVWLSCRVLKAPTRAVASTGEKTATGLGALLSGKSTCLAGMCQAPGYHPNTAKTKEEKKKERL
jgi:hypothetical protein